MRYVLVFLVSSLLSSCLLFKHTPTELDKLYELNTKINAYPYISDQMLYGKEDHWATPFEFMINGAGDCEDYAIMKHHLLENKQGVVLLVVQVNLTNQYHAVLNVRGYILDNRTNEIIHKNSAAFKRKYKYIHSVVL